MCIEHLYPLSPYQRAIFDDIVNCLAKRRRFQEQSSHCGAAVDFDWAKYRVLCFKPGTGKSQVLICAIHHAAQEEFPVLVYAPVALLAPWYQAIFSTGVTTETIHAAFHILVTENVCHDVNFNLNAYDMVVVDQASMVSPQTFSTMASTFNRLNLRPVVVIAGDKYQQQPLQTVDGRVSSTSSILNTQTFSPANAVRHSLYEQFRIVDPDYACFVNHVCIQPTQPRATGRV